MTLGIDEDVLRLHIPVSDTLDIVQEFQDQDDFRSIEARGVDVEPARTPQIPKNLSSRAVVKLHQSVISMCYILFSSWYCGPAYRDYLGRRRL